MPGVLPLVLSQLPLLNGHMTVPFDCIIETLPEFPDQVKITFVGLLDTDIVSSCASIDDAVLVASYITLSMT